MPYRICTQTDRRTNDGAPHTTLPFPPCLRLEQPRFVGEGPIVNDFPEMSYHRLVDVSSVGVNLASDARVSRINEDRVRVPHLELRHVPILDLCIGRIIGPCKVYPFN